MKLASLMLLVVLLYIISVFEPSSGWLFKKKNWPVQATGRITCDVQAMPFVRVRLMDKDPVFDDKMGSTRTNSRCIFN